MNNQEIYVKNQYGIEIDFEAAAGHMDDEIKEDLNYLLAPCSNQMFWDAYCIAHEQKFGEEFFLNEENPVW